MKANSIHGLFVCVFLFLFCQNCAPMVNKSANSKSKIDRKSHSLIDYSFSIKENKGQKILGIKKSALNKEFLLRANLIQGGQAPKFENLKSRIVIFKDIDGDLFLMEANEGHEYHKDLAQSLILARFKKVNETSNTIFFDFNGGMSRLYTFGDWYAKDVYGTKQPEFAKQFASIKIATSYIDQSFMTPDNTLIIHQKTLINISENYDLPAEIRYSISPYQPNHNFKPLDTQKIKHLGFFEANPWIDSTTEDEIIHATKFDHTKSIVFAISDNTPEEFKPAIRDGILYWNKAFGRDVIDVINAPEKMHAPDYRNNIVQWVDWDSAGFAYADAQMDPRTGEVLNAQVFMTSAFAVSSQKRAKELVDEWLKRQKIHKNEVSAQGSQLNEPFNLTLQGFKAEPLCYFSESEAQFFNSLISLLNDNNANDESFKKLSYDYIRHVIAHEIGHTLGLRHNFAASLSANISLSQSEQLIKNYLIDNNIPDNTIVTTSVMDYLLFNDTVISGYQIKNAQNAHPYDQLAIEVLYGGKELKDSESPLFCTDSDIESYFDCNRFDSGPSVFSSSQFKMQKALERIPMLMANLWVSHQNQLNGINALVEKITKEIIDHRSSALNALKHGSHSVVIEHLENINNRFDNDSPISEATFQLIRDQLNEAGGMKALLTPIPQSLLEEWQISFSRYMQNHFSDLALHQQKDATNWFNLISKKFANSLLKHDIVQLALMDNIAEEDSSANSLNIGEEYAEIMAQKVREILFAINGSSSATGRIELTLEISQPFVEHLGQNYFEATIPASTSLPATKAVRLAQMELAQQLKSYETSSAVPSEGVAITVADTPKLPLKLIIPAQLVLPKFKYPYPLRIVAASLLSRQKGSSLNFGFRERHSLSFEMSKIMQESLLGLASSEYFPLTSQSNPVTKWVLEQKGLIEMLNNPAKLTLNK